MLVERNRNRWLSEVETKSLAIDLVSTSLNQRFRVSSTSVFDFAQPAFSTSLKWHIRLTEKL
jgi:hypothetical protein